jgi:spore coat polysaccharide biosynthesis protein SpsF (cytidylyltransferase family)
MNDGERTFDTQAEAVLDAFEDCIAEGGGTVTVCVGAECPFLGNEFENQEAGCPICRRFEIGADGSIQEFMEALN